MTDQSRFLNRELTWLAFNHRVLAEARNEQNPLLERVRFLSISASNWDEFTMVRVAGLRVQADSGVTTPTQDGLSPAQQLAAILDRSNALMRNQYECWDQLRALLEEEQIRLVTAGDLSARDLELLDQRFQEEIFPLLTPLAVDPAAAFPFLPNLGLCLFADLLRPDGDPLQALVPVPRQIERFLRLPGEGIRFISLEDTLRRFLDRLYPGTTVVQSGCFRVIRDSALEIDERADDLVETFETALRKRRKGSVVRLSVSADLPTSLRQVLAAKLDVAEEDVYPRTGILGLADLSALVVDDRPELLYEPFEPRFPQRVVDHGGDVFAAIRSKDLVVHHPYESFDVVARFVLQAARDPDVVAIKQTLYRTSRNSPIVAALIEAAEAGKQVTAVVELKARFDEEANIQWAKALEQAGAHVVYGFVDKKIHAKVNLVVRREDGFLRTYAHFGTGNYHPVTARIYTDLSLFTCEERACRDAARLFNYMTGFVEPEELEVLRYSPRTMRPALVALIDEEIAMAEAGSSGEIWIKLNSLIDGQMIDALYRASQAGVRVRAVVRGICGLRPGVPGLSENIEIRSIVGRFLEHSRIIAFGRGQALPNPEAKVFISSADWMPRNLNRRVEVLVPVENPTVHRQLLEEIMRASLEDEVNSWRLGPEGTYSRVKTGDHPKSAHRYFMTHTSLSGMGSSSEKAPLDGAAPRPEGQHAEAD